MNGNCGRLKNKVALVTGGAKGIGAAIAKLFASEGAKVAIMDVLEPSEPLDPGIIFLRGDVSQAKQCEQTVAETVRLLGGLQILVNNAAISCPGKLHEDSSIELWHQVLNTNLHGVFYMTKAALSAMMLAKTPCSIINMASIAASVINPVVHPSYAASKGAILSLTRYIAPAYARYQIRCNAICPGAVKTPLWDTLPADVQQLYGDLHPLGAGQVDDVAFLALYLASDQSKWMTGTLIDLDGGNLAAGGLATLSKSVY
jgi:NAD(P)-dependent dehydrogenase (short-subunit alcohol dehydrogenase family)